MSRRTTFGALLVGVFTLTGAPPLSGAQVGAGETLRRWAEALGGAERLRAVRMIHTRYNVIAAGLEGTLEEWVTADGRRRTDLDLGIYTTLTVCTPRDCWMVGPNGKRSDITGDELKSERTATYIGAFSHLLPERAKGTARIDEAAGSRKVEVVEFVPTDGAAARFRIDRATGLPLSSVMPDDPRAITIRYGDWRNVNGILFPYVTTQWTDDGKPYATSTVKEILINETVDDTLFATPPETAALVRFESGRSSPFIPFRLEGNQILLDVSINGSGPALFVLDTGAQMSVLDADWAAELGLQLQGNVQGMGAGEEALRLSLAGVDSIALPGVTLKDQLFATLPLSPFRVYTGRRWYGILGYNFISRFVVEIDFQHRRLRLHDPKSYVYDGDGDELPVTIDRQHPLVYGSLEWGEHELPDFRRFEGLFLVDTGHGGQLTINRKFIEANDILSVVDETLEAPLGFGAGGETRGVLARIPNFRIGRFVLHRPVAGFSTDKGGALGTFSFAGVIGTEILRRFNVVIDYERKRLILEKNDAFDEPFEQNMLGALFVLDGDSGDGGDGGDHTGRIVVRSVLDGSPAAKAGLRAGDTVLRIDGEPVGPGDLERCREMMKKDGVKVKITVERNGRERTVEVVTRRMI